MGESIDWSKMAMTAVDLFNKFSQAVDTYNSEVGNKYEIEYDTSRSTVVEVKDDNTSVFRADRAHKGHHEYDHININEKISGIKDPHVRLPPGGAETSRYVAKLCQMSSENASTALAVTRTLKVGSAMMEDYQHDSVRNTVETAASLTGGYLGASLGSSAGADIGKKILPGVGEILGGVIGAIAGGIAGANSAQTLAGQLCDANELDIVKRTCRRCGCKFIAKLYRGESLKFKCDDCN